MPKRPPRNPSTTLRDAVFAIVRSIPPGRVMTYGQVALLCGVPRAAQAVGWTLHTAPADVPCQRVVNRHGGLASGYTDGGRPLQRAELEAEGVSVREDDTVELEHYQWWPSAQSIAAVSLPEQARARATSLLDAASGRNVLHRTPRRRSAT